MTSYDDDVRIVLEGVRWKIRSTDYHPRTEPCNSLVVPPSQNPQRRISEHHHLYNLLL
jgi:hypothetical protein